MGIQETPLTSIDFRFLKGYQGYSFSFLPPTSFLPHLTSPPTHPMSAAQRALQNRLESLTHLYSTWQSEPCSCFTHRCYGRIQNIAALLTYELFLEGSKFTPSSWDCFVFKGFRNVLLPAFPQPNHNLLNEAANLL